ncbi:MAG: S41 family peptidase [Sorangiineae bacterium]|nr:S41 family peptidase [Sorangiineae bacterium]MEB2343301.1 S41 family peptidase [Deltaproteobacteria bacterium]
MARSLLAAALALSLALAAAQASATEFDAAGRATFSAKAAWTLGFEPGEPALPDAGEPDAGDAGGPTPLDIAESQAALEGSHVLAVPRFAGVSIPLALPASPSSYRVTVWARGELIATVEASYGEGRVDEFGSLYPTGRMTSDGWYELETRGFSFDSSRAKLVEVGLFSPTGAEADAVEFVPDGAAAPSAACRGAIDDRACGAGRACQWGECRSMSPRVPRLPADAERDDLVAYLQGRFRLLFGPFRNRRLDLPSALAELDAMRSAADAWSFWRHFEVAVHRLHDWHTQSTGIAGFVLEQPKPISVCFIEGVADASSGVTSPDPSRLDVLVSHVGTVNALGLHAGDRLVSVDGKHPVEWARSLIGVDDGFWTASNHETHAEDVARLPGLIARFAERFEVLRCDAASGGCAGAPETLRVADIARVPAGVRADVSCDNRPRSHLPGTPPEHSRDGFYSGIVLESDSSEAIYGLEWSSLYVTGRGEPGDVGPQLAEAVATWRARARGVVLDHRSGFGGTSLGPAMIWDFVRKPVKLDSFRFRDRADEEGPASLAEGKALFDALGDEVEVAGSASARTDVPVALLTHLDGSASDWLPLGLKGAPKARIFAPFETAGGFSTRYQFGYWLGLGYSIAVGDTLAADGRTLNGTGVAPDVVVLPLQSDLLAGRDTVYDAALAWVRQELAP